MPLLMAALLIVGAYLLGGVPWGLLLGQWFRGVDIRRHGSGKTGATNAARTLGWRISALVFLLDVAKGSGAVLLARALTGEPLVEALAGVAAVAGHCWSPYIRFGGGRGVATGMGGALATVPVALLLMLPVGLLVMRLTRYVSLASIMGAATVPIGMIISALLGYTAPAYIVYGLGGAAIIIGKHHDNIRRLLAGTERKIGERVTVGGAAAPQGSSGH